jgi:hypothetical protein
MRGPLLSGALGSAATLDRVVELVRPHQPIVVLSALWLAETLATELPVLALVEKEKLGAATRAGRRAKKLALPLSIVAAAGEVPLAPKRVGAVLLDNMMDIEEVPAAADLLLGLLPSMLPDSVVVSLDATKNPHLEARVAEIFLAASLTHIRQLRPKDGALLTLGKVPPPEVIDARAKALGLAHP